MTPMEELREQAAKIAEARWIVSQIGRVDFPGRSIKERHANRGIVLAALSTPTETPTAAAPDDGLMGRFRALVVAAQRVLDGGYVSEHIEEEKADHKALKDALAALSTATGDEGGK